MKIQVTRQARIALAGALIGALVGAIGSLLYVRLRGAKVEEAGEKLAVAKEEVLSVQRVGSIIWAGVKLVREVMDLGAGNEE